MPLYNVNEPSKYISYLDENSLYGLSMTQYLLYSQFKWLNQKGIDRIEVTSVCKNNPIDYIC